MSSNVGLSTPRGSGTSGYVQKNHAFLRPRDGPAHNQPSSMAPPRKPRTADASILLHEQKRNIEVSCLELQDELEEAGELNEEEIEERVDELRKKLTAELESGGAGAGPVGGRGRDGAGGRREFKSYEVHEMAAQKEMETERLRRALGIGKDYEEGSHWRRQEEERERRLRNDADGEDGEVRERRDDRGGYRDSRDSRGGRDSRDGGRRSEGGRRRSRSASPER